MGKAKTPQDELDQRDPTEPQGGEQDETTTETDTAATETAAEAPPAPPAWQTLDYCGPLTGDQADWRNRHIKPGATGYIDK